MEELIDSRVDLALIPKAAVEEAPGTLGVIAGEVGKEARLVQQLRGLQFAQRRMQGVVRHLRDGGEKGSFLVSLGRETSCRNDHNGSRHSHGQDCALE